MLEYLRNVQSIALHRHLPQLFDVEIFARLLNVYGMENTIQMSYEHPVSKWTDIDGSKVKPIFFLKAPFELFKIVRHYKLR